MLLLLLSLYTTPAPDIVGLAIDAMLRADSLAASQPVLVPFESVIRSIAKETGVSAGLLAGIIQEESRFDEWATRMEPRYMNSKRVKHQADLWSTLHHGLPTAFTERADRSRSYGLMQIMGETAREEGYDARYLASLFAAPNGLRAGAKHLKMLLARYPHDTLAAISAYNQGSARKRSGVFANARYVYRVAIAWRMYDALLNGGRHDE